MEGSPNGLQLAELDYESTFEMLAEATQLVQEPASRSTIQIQRLGAWVWALLAKVEELGTLSSEEVGFVRELGKAAIEVIRRRVMGEDDVAEVKIRTHEENDMQKPSQVSSITGSGYASASSHRKDVPTISTDEVERGRSAKSRPPRRRRNSSSDVSESDELNHSRTLEFTSSQPGLDEQESLEKARMRLLQRMAETAPEQEQQQARGHGVDHAGKTVNPAVMEPAEEEDGEVVESADETEDKAAEVAVTEEAFEEEEEQKSKQMNAMLDMILTIVGEEFGQRDLLVARDVLWDI